MYSRTRLQFLSGVTKLRSKQRSKQVYSILTNSKPITTVLGIETSCDDTGCAVVDHSGRLLGESLYSQNLVHLRNGGINPMVAQELHRDNIEAAVAESLTKASLNITDIDAIAVTVKPGLRASLDIGVKYAKYLARHHQKPLVPIHHMEAHALVARMYNDIKFPFLVLLISGGHCLLAVAKDVDDFVLLGDCLDDAPGEAFDKVARRMKIRNIPMFSHLAGGRAIELAATMADDPDLFQFPSPLVRNRDCNFSFSGLKETLYRKLVKLEIKHEIIADGVIPEIYDMCAAFQLAVAEHLVHRTHRAAEYCVKRNVLPADNKTLVVSGGVACNNFIFKALKVLGDKIGYKVVRPPPKICTDNGIMIAWNGVEKLRKGLNFSSNFDMSIIEPKAPLGNNLIEAVKEANLPIRVTRLKSVYKKYFSGFDLPILNKKQRITTLEHSLIK